MSAKERSRMGVMDRVSEGVLKLKIAAEMMKLSYRQAKRIFCRYKKEGAFGLVHKGRGKVSNRRRSDAERKRAVALYEKKFAGFGPLLASEHLESDYGLSVDHETLRRWLISEGHWKAGHKKEQHRAARERRPRRGDLVQVDGSDHDWFEGRGPRAVLMVMIDDATNTTLARLYDSEDTSSAYDIFERYVRLYGLPTALYPDRDSIYVCTRESNIEEDLAVLEPETQFARAMRELKVDIIPAYSPQAKGRVERRHGLFQDRLVKEMRLLGIGSIEAANQYLDETFLTFINTRYTVAPADPVNGHRKCPSDAKLAMTLSWQEARTVAKDWTVRWRNQRFQIDARHSKLGLAGRRVTIVEQANGSLVILYKERSLTFRVAPCTATTPVKPKPQPEKMPHKPWVPPPGHPWRHLAITRQQFSRPLRRAILPILGERENQRATPSSISMTTT